MCSASSSSAAPATPANTFSVTVSSTRLPSLLGVVIRPVCFVTAPVMLVLPSRTLSLVASSSR